MEKVIIKGVVEKESEKAIKLAAKAIPPAGHHEIQVRVWVPKSQVVQKGEGEFEVPDWLVAKKNEELFNQALQRGRTGSPRLMGWDENDKLISF